jgi:hypothetical protein
MYRNYDIKPVKTEYKGIVFRSKLEAQWAVFFDGIGLKWEYESCMFNTRHGGYCPDFYLPTVCDGIYIEIKPTKETNIERDKLEDVSKQSGKICIFQIGRPLTSNIDLLHSYVLHSYDRRIITASLDGSEMFADGFFEESMFYEPVKIGMRR